MMPSTALYPCLCAAFFVAVLGCAPLRGETQWVTYAGGEGAGKGKHIVLISGDEEYRSEEALPQLGKILAQRHGFTCTVLFAINPDDGTIDPNHRHNIPGLEKLAEADLMVIATRFRDLPDEQMRHIVAYVESGGPIIGMRTATHAFNIEAGRTYHNWTWNSTQWPGGFGRQILGETWVAHHGRHSHEATRGIIAPQAVDHPILRGIEAGTIFGPTDVYTINLPIDGDARVLVMGQIVAGMNPDDPPATDERNNPMMPVAWTRTYTAPSGTTGRVFTTTLGASQDLAYEGTRRMLVNACYWAAGLEADIAAQSNVDYVGDYHPTPFGFNGFKKNVRPSDLAMPVEP